MTNKAHIEKLAQAKAKNPFSVTSHHTINQPLKRIFETFRSYNNEVNERDVKDEDVISAVTPGFQRDNDKWSLEMKTSFVQNVVSGLRSPIQLYAITERDQFTNCKIMDGLQRSTAIGDWVLDRFPIWGDIYFSQVNSPYLSLGSMFTIEILRFDSELEAVTHYIGMNEFITHSPEDINRAKEYRARLIENLSSN